MLRMEVPNDKLHINYEYHRNIDRERLNYLIDNYDPNLVGRLKVARRDGKYYVLDGMHRLVAIRRKHSSATFPVDCDVVDCKTLEEEIQLFRGLEMGMEAEPRQYSTIEDLPSDVLEIDPTYQRPVDRAQVRKILAHFDPKLVNVLKVSARNGHYYVVDGSHTLAALRERNPQPFNVTCKVFHGLSYEDEARMFALQTGDAKKVGIPYTLRALEIARDPDTEKFLNCTRLSGFEITPGERTTQRKCSIAAVRKAHDIYKDIGDENYSRMLRLMMAAWNGEPKSVCQNMLGAMCMILKTYKDKLRDDRFIRRLRGTTYDKIHEDALATNSFSSAHAHAIAIMKTYNKGGGKGTLDIPQLSF